MSFPVKLSDFEFHHSIFDLALIFSSLPSPLGPDQTYFFRRGGFTPNPVLNLQPPALRHRRHSQCGARNLNQRRFNSLGATFSFCGTERKNRLTGELPRALAALPGSSPLFPPSSFLSHRTLNGSGDVENGNLCKGECCCSSCPPHRVQTALQNERSPASHHLSCLVQIFMKRRHGRGRREEEERGVRTLG